MQTQFGGIRASQNFNRNAMARQGAPRNEFDDWYQNIPEDRRFSPTVLRPEQEVAFNKWKYDNGFFNNPNQYDLRGWFAKTLEDPAGKTTNMVQNPDGSVTPHTGSIGIDGKILKNQNYPTFHMTALSEIARASGMNDATLPWNEIRSENDSLRVLREFVARTQKK